MATVEEPEVVEPVPVDEPFEQLPWREELARNWMNMRMGHEAMQLDKAQRRARIVEELAEQARLGKFGEITLPEDDPMGVSIGNQIHNHYASQTTQSPSPVTEPKVVEKVIEKVVTVGKPLSKWVVGSLVGGPIVGAALGLGGGWLLSDKPKPVVTKDTDTDSAIEYTPRFVEPK